MATRFKHGLFRVEYLVTDCNIVAADGNMLSNINRGSNK